MKRDLRVCVNRDLEGLCEERDCVIDLEGLCEERLGGTV